MIALLNFGNGLSLPLMLSPHRTQGKSLGFHPSQSRVRVTRKTLREGYRISSIKTIFEMPGRLLYDTITNGLPSQSA